MKFIGILSTLLFIAFANAKDTKATKEAMEKLTIDPKESSINWVASKKTGDKHMGQVKLKEGDIELKKGKLEGGHFTVDMTSLSNDDLKDKPDYQTKLITHLKSDDFFKVEKNPEAKFVITKVKEKDGSPWVMGKLTFIGKTNPIEFPVKMEEKDGMTIGTAKIEIDRTKWGLVYGSGNIFKELTLDKIINDKFDLEVKLVAKK